MFFLPRLPNADQTNRRVTGRVKVENSLECNLGRVVDLSAGGLCVVSRKPLDGVVVVTLSDSEGGLTCEAKVVRSLRLGFFRHEVGLQLPPMDDRDRATLTRLAAFHRDRRLTDAA